MISISDMRQLGFPFRSALLDLFIFDLDLCLISLNFLSQLQFHWRIVLYIFFVLFDEKSKGISSQDSNRGCISSGMLIYLFIGIREN
jgi:hypothetical protein